MVSLENIQTSRLYLGLCMCIPIKYMHVATINEKRGQEFEGT